ncbi:MAG: DUF819 family protein [Treponema sp.]|nr:DUF819 family protein [Treponema sp.]
MESLIRGEDTVLMWMVVISVVGISVSMERKWKWATTIGSFVLCILIGMILANIRVIPFTSPVYAATSGVLLPLAIPLMLFKSDLRRIIKESGQMLLIYNIIAVAAFFSALLIPVVWANVEGIREYAAAQTGGFIGGTVNVVALSQIFALSPEFLFGITIVGNFFVGVMVLFLNAMYKMNFFKKNFRYGANEESMEAFAQEGTDQNQKQIDMIGIFQSLMVALMIFGASTLIARQVNSIQGVPFVIGQMFGSIWILMTIITTILATLFPKFLGNLKGSTEMGTMLMLVWFVTIGTTADLQLILTSGLIVLLAYIMAFIICCLVIFSIGRFFKWRLENMMACINACIGGPPTVAALCATMKWNKLIVPGILVALYGVIIGNFTGILIGNIWGALPFGG